MVLKAVKYLVAVCTCLRIGHVDILNIIRIRTHQKWELDLKLL